MVSYRVLIKSPSMTAYIKANNVGLPPHCAYFGRGTSAIVAWCFNKRVQKKRLTDQSQNA